MTKSTAQKLGALVPTMEKEKALDTFQYLDLTMGLPSNELKEVISMLVSKNISFDSFGEENVPSYEQLKKSKKSIHYLNNYDVIAFNASSDDEMKKFYRNQIVERNAPLVKDKVRDEFRWAIPDHFDDLFQEGCIGVMRAVEKFDVTVGVKFSTYATHWIKQKCHLYLEEVNPVHIPSNIRLKISTINKAEKALNEQLGRTPTSKEISDATKIPEEDIKNYKMYASKAASLSAPINSDGGDDSGELRLEDALSCDNESYNPESSALQDDCRQELLKVLASLDETDKMIILLRNGFVDGTRKTLEETGKAVGLTRETVRQREKRTYDKLKRRKSISVRLKIFYDEM